MHHEFKFLFIKGYYPHFGNRYKEFLKKLRGKITRYNLRGAFKDKSTKWLSYVKYSALTCLLNTYHFLPVIYFQVNARRTKFETLSLLSLIFIFTKHHHVSLTLWFLHGRSRSLVIRSQILLIFCSIYLIVMMLTVRSRLNLVQKYCSFP